VADLRVILFGKKKVRVLARSYRIRRERAVRKLQDGSGVKVSSRRELNETLGKGPQRSIKGRLRWEANRKKPPKDGEGNRKEGKGKINRCTHTTPTQEGERNTLEGVTAKN